MEGIVIERAGTTKRDEYGHAAVSQSTRSQALREPRRSATRVTPMVPQLREGVAPQIDGGHGAEVMGPLPSQPGIHKPLSNRDVRKMECFRHASSQ